MKGERKVKGIGVFRENRKLWGISNYQVGLVEVLSFGVGGEGGVQVEQGREGKCSNGRCLF